MPRKPSELSTKERQAIQNALIAWRRQWLDQGDRERQESIDLALLADLSRSAASMQHALQRLMKNAEMHRGFAMHLMLLQKPPRIEDTTLNELAVVFRVLERMTAICAPFLPKPGPKPSPAQISFIKTAANIWAASVRKMPTDNGRFAVAIGETKEYPCEGLTRERIKAGLDAWKRTAVGRRLVAELAEQVGRKG
jgi:hypothetical protein